MLTVNDLLHLEPFKEFKMISGFEGSIIGAKYVEPYINNAALTYLILKPTVIWQKQILEKVFSLAEIYENKKDGYEMDMRSQLQFIWQILVKNYFVINLLPCYRVVSGL